MLKPEKLFSLPQDVYLEIGKAKSTPEEFEEFKKRTTNAKWKTLDQNLVNLYKIIFYGKRRNNCCIWC